MAQPASLLLVAAALFSAVLAAASGLASDRARVSVRFMFLANLGTLAWASAYFVQLGWSRYPDPALAPFGSPDYILLLVVVVGIGVSATYWFLFCASLSPRGTWWTRGRGLAVAHLPAVYVFLAAAFNPFNHLFMRMGPTGPVGGILVMPHYATMLLLLGGGIAYAVPTRSEGITTSTDRRRRIAVALVACLPLLGTIAWGARRLAVISLPFNPTPALFSLVGCVIGYQVLYRGLGDIVPLATLSSIVQHTDAHLAYLTPAFRFVSVNSAFLKRSRHTENELIGLSYFDVMPDDGRRRLFQEACDRRRPVERSDDAGVFPAGADEPAAYWSWWLTPVTDAVGELQGLVLSIAEVTESIRERELARTLARLDMSLHRDFASEGALWEVVTTAANALGCKVTLVTGAPASGWRVRGTCEWSHSERYDPEMLPHIEFAIDTGQTVLIPDAQFDERFEATIMVALRIRSALVVPLTSHHGVLGALSFEREDVCGPFAGAEVDFAERFASAVTLALENARLYHEERRIAQTLQESMLRISFAAPGVDFSHKYRSATEAARVGGDFYDLFRTDDGRVGMLIGDVSGHGIEAAVLTSLIKNTVRSEAMEHRSPARVMRKVSEVLWRQSEPDVFASAFLGFLDPATGRMWYCSAGHPPVMRLSADGCVTELPQHSVVLGAVSGATFASAEARLRPGETLVMYTDGLTEARHGNEFFGARRLEEALSPLAGLPAREVVDELFGTVRTYARDSFSDDIAMVAVRLTPPALESLTDVPASAPASA